MGRRRVCLAVAAIVAAPIGSGCQRDDDARRRRRAATVSKPAPPIRVLSETVLRRGAEPHRLLRYRRRPAVEHRHARVVSAEITEIENRVKRPPKKLPVVTTGFALSWRDAGSPVVEIRALSPEVAASSDPKAARFAREQLARYRGLIAGKSATLSLSDRGLLEDIGGMGGSTDARRELAAALVDSIAVLPEVPVGPGARWRVVRAVPRARTSVKQQATYTLVSVDGDRLAIEVELLTIGERQPIALTAAPGVASELLALRVSQTGELVVDLTTPTVKSGTLARSDTVHLRTTRLQKTLRDYFAQSRSEVRLSTK